MVKWLGWFAQPLPETPRLDGSTTARRTTSAERTIRVVVNNDASIFWFREMSTPRVVHFVDFLRRLERTTVRMSSSRIAVLTAAMSASASNLSVCSMYFL